MVKSMIENYLITKWQQGALAGAKPDDAFFVKVGLGVTMTADDILNGIMNVEIGMAVARPRNSSCSNSHIRCRLVSQ
jgi:phage tail sheath protein FI